MGGKKHSNQEYGTIVKSREGFFTMANFYCNLSTTEGKNNIFSFCHLLSEQQEKGCTFLHRGKKVTLPRQNIEARQNNKQQTETEKHKCY